MYIRMRQQWGHYYATDRFSPHFDFSIDIYLNERTNQQNVSDSDGCEAKIGEPLKSGLHAPKKASQCRPPWSGY
jgi:hypothetical protein